MIVSLLRKKTLLIFGLSLCLGASAQIDEDQPGAWYMYFWNARFKAEKPWGIQGDVQHRNWNMLGDLEQLLIRSGVTYSPTGAGVKFTLGYANIHTGSFGSGKQTVREDRIYQEALFPQKLGNRFYLSHRLRYEQRFVASQDFRTRYRYALFLNVPLNTKEMKKGAVYLALYNELFINGQERISTTRTVSVFDRNRLYSGLGYKLGPKLRVQLGYMLQTTDNWGKGQLQYSLFHNISG